LAFDDQALPNPRWWFPRLALVGRQSITTASVAARAFMSAVWFPCTMYVASVTPTFPITDPTTNVRLGIYADNGNTPAGGSLVSQSDSIKLDVVNPVFTLPTPIRFLPGISAWLVMMTDTTLTSFLRYKDDGYPLPELTGEALKGCFFNQKYGKFPAVCPAVTLTSISPYFALQISQAG